MEEAIPEVALHLSFGFEDVIGLMEPLAHRLMEDFVVAILVFRGELFDPRDLFCASLLQADAFFAQVHQAGLDVFVLLRVEGDRFVFEEEVLLFKLKALAFELFDLLRKRLDVLLGAIHREQGVLDGFGGFLGQTRPLNS